MAEKKYDKMWEMARKTVEARRAKKGKSGASPEQVGRAFMDKIAKRTDFKKDGSKRMTSVEGADYYMSQKIRRSGKPFRETMKTNKGPAFFETMKTNKRPAFFETMKTNRKKGKK